MERELKIQTISEIRSIVISATELHEKVCVADSFGNSANAKSIIALMSLNYTKPVFLKAESECVLLKVYNDFLSGCAVSPGKVMA